MVFKWKWEKKCLIFCTLVCKDEVLILQLCIVVLRLSKTTSCSANLKPNFKKLIYLLHSRRSSGSFNLKDFWRLLSSRLAYFYLIFSLSPSKTVIFLVQAINNLRVVIFICFFDENNFFVTPLFLYLFLQVMGSEFANTSGSPKGVSDFVPTNHVWRKNIHIENLDNSAWVSQRLQQF